MTLFSDAQRRAADSVAALSYCNPFLPERIAYERTILGLRFVGTDGAWHKHMEEEVERPNLRLLTDSAKGLADAGRQKLVQGNAANRAEADLYEDTALYYLYNKYADSLLEFMLGAEHGDSGASRAGAIYSAFRKDMVFYFDHPGLSTSVSEAEHMFACFFQLRRAWRNIYDYIIGGSMVSAELRAAVWQSVFTCDLRRYRRGVFSKMNDITTLIVGPSGTGKEIVARAIAMSRYIPFEAKSGQFTSDFTRCFYPINLSALSPTLIESELFGHQKGAFTGAIADRTGFLEMCSADGAVFLDEIGELDPTLQVKLLRVLQTRTLQRIGDTSDRRFQGKAIAATNRDPSKELREGRFREDLYYRLCSDVIVTPRLRDQIEGAPEQLQNLLLFLARRVAGPEEAERLAREVADWIHSQIPSDYAWPGNVRELEQCVRNIMIRKAYRPVQSTAESPAAAFARDMAAGAFTLDTLTRRYCTLVYAQTGSYQETARRLGADRRTVKDRIDHAYLDTIRRA